MNAVCGPVVSLTELQGELNGVYDNFVAQCGALSTSANSRLMRGDPSWPVMLALEIWDDEEQKAVKADIFSKRTVGKAELPTHVDNVKDAMLISLALYGKIVLKDMAVRTGLPVMDVVNGLKADGLAYRDPVLGRWVPSDEYLSGNIRDKIAQAKAAGVGYEGNVESLTAVLPKDLGPAEVEARLGANWIPTEVIRQFAEELVLIPRKHSRLDVSYDGATATWALMGKSYGQLWNMGDNSCQRIKWGTDRRSALELLQGALNQQPPTVHDTIEGRQVVNPRDTLAAREKWQAIRDHFRQWVYADDSRRDKLLRIYNDTFNQIVQRKYDGSHLHLPGMTALVKPYAFQKDVIWRIMIAGNTLLAHAVGAGKTLEMLAASMEMRRLGKARKPAHIVLNHCLEQYVAEALRLYPQARVLMATKDDLSGDRRRTFVGRVATGDWNMVVMTQATFQSLMLSPSTQKEFIDQQMGELRSAMALADDRGAKRSIKEMERRLADYEAKLKRLIENGLTDENAVYFDHLGIDCLFLDEAHVYKNLGRVSKMPRVAGLPNVASQRAFDVFMKTRVIMNQRGGAQENVIMATATPVTNSIAELHTMQVYLQPQTLKKYGIYEFDAWSANFGEAVTGIELAPDGSGFRTNTRYSRFTNLPELMSVFREVADIKTKRMLNLPTPPIQGGGPQTIVVKQSDALKELTQELVTNVQTRLVAVHQLDCPWRPSDVEQRDGRIDRQGNMCESIMLFRYVTESSFDAYSWQVLSVKANFIEQIMTAEQGLRSVEDLSMTAMSYAEIKAIASGNPLVLEKATVDMEVQKQSLRLSHWEQDRWRTGLRMADLKTRLAYIDKVMPSLEKDVGEAQAAAKATFKVLGGLLNKAEPGISDDAAIGTAFKVAAAQKCDCQIGSMGSFKLFMVTGWGRAELEIEAPHSGFRRIANRPTMLDIVGVGESAMEVIKAFETLPQQLRIEYDAKAEELARAQQFLTEDFEGREALNEALSRQRAIEAELNLDKATEGTAAMQTETV